MSLPGPSAPLSPGTAILTLPPCLVPLLQAANALTYDELQSLTYLQVKGSGLANTCPVVSGGSTNLKDLKAGSYKLERFCMEPTSFSVKEESQFKGGDTNFVSTKLMTRLTYTLDGVSSGGRRWRAGGCAQQAELGWSDRADLSSSHVASVMWDAGVEGVPGARGFRMARSRRHLAQRRRRQTATGLSTVAAAVGCEKVVG